MSILLPGILIILTAFLLHLAVWRLLQRHEPIHLVVFFSVVFAISVTILALFPEAFLTLNLEPLNPVGYAHLVFFLAAFLSAYFLFYHMLIDDSPTLTVVKHVYRAGEGGLSLEALDSVFTDQAFVHPRIDYLVQKGMIALENETYHITPKGVSFLRSILVFRNLMRLKDDVG